MHPDGPELRTSDKISKDARPRRRREAAPVIEMLEGRALLSGFVAAGRPALAAAIGRPQVEAGSLPQELRAARARAFPVAFARPFHGPLTQRIVGGHVSKQPRFYTEYQGPTRPELNGIGAMGHLIQGVGYVFTGRVLGAINPSEPAEYVFGINRGGAKGPTTINVVTGDAVNFSGGQSMVQFPRRPNIFVDALVTVAVGPLGTTGTVRLQGQDPGTGTPIPSQNIQINGRDITVLVDPALLPPNGARRVDYAYAFWVRAGGISGPGGVASFVPEYNVTPIGSRMSIPAHAIRKPPAITSVDADPR